MMTNQDPLSIVAYLILMDHHGEGFERAHPDYLMEKLYIINQSAPDAIANLDLENQQRVRIWCKIWNYPIPEELETWFKKLSNEWID